MNKVNPRGYLGRQDWFWWALTIFRYLDAGILLVFEGEFGPEAAQGHGRVMQRHGTSYTNAQPAS